MAAADMHGRQRPLWLRVIHGTLALVAACALTLALFLVLPLMQQLGAPPAKDLVFRGLDTAALPPPPPSPPEQEEEEPQEPEEPPKLESEAPPLDLSQLELALNPGMGDGMFGDFAVKLAGQFGEDGEGAGVDEIFSLADLDQRPRVLFQRPPDYPMEARRRGRQGTVYLIFMVDRQGRVVNPRVEKSSDPVFERPALEAVRQWKFEPGTRKGEAVAFKMRIPITFNATS